MARVSDGSSVTWPQPGLVDAALALLLFAGALLEVSLDDLPGPVVAKITAVVAHDVAARLAYRRSGGDGGADDGRLCPRRGPWPSG